ncbi:hypothetical protein Pcinc_039383 [Petrolisthes cinctipes]|uniref:Uncharacterized protein n=1 Tax=Petrolisthes cinctipes TaxID=88211 RepID=A0AAE1EJ51_PETCI|nr:hypothetical protein Pcinc_039383 [Petrolisthes cinctipes]
MSSLTNIQPHTFSLLTPCLPLPIPSIHASPRLLPSHPMSSLTYTLSPRIPTPSPFPPHVFPYLYPQSTHPHAFSLPTPCLPLPIPSIHASPRLLPSHPMSSLSYTLNPRFPTPPLFPNHASPIV